MILRLLRTPISFIVLATSRNNRKMASMLLLLLASTYYWFYRSTLIVIEGVTVRGKRSKSIISRHILRHLYELPHLTHHATIEIEKEFIAMSDGVRLATTILIPYHDHNEKAFPTILIRTPYSRSSSRMSAERFVERGFAVVIQDTRGRFSSEGAFGFLLGEKEDGIDTIKWVSKQKWCNGKIGVWGISYVGYAAWATASGLQELINSGDENLQVCAIFPVMTTSSFYSAIFPNGTFAFDFVLRYVHTIKNLGSFTPNLSPLVGGLQENASTQGNPEIEAKNRDSLENQDLSSWVMLGEHKNPTDGEIQRYSPEHAAKIAQTIVNQVKQDDLYDWRASSKYMPVVHKEAFSFKDMMNVFFFLWGDQDKAVKKACMAAPISKAQELLVGNLPGVPQFVPNPQEAFWTMRDHTIARNSGIPIHSVCGWYDIFLKQQLEDYERLQNLAPENKFLTIGPWTHMESINSNTLRIIWKESLDWFCHFLKDPSDPHPIQVRKPIKLFVMYDRSNKGVWKEFDAWPPEPTRVDLYLHPFHKLLPYPPPHAIADNISCPPFDEFTFDPIEPTPSFAGPLFHPTNAGEMDNQKLEMRHDVLLYTSEPLEKDLEVIGFVQAEIQVASSCRLCDLFVRLNDVHPSGESFNVCDGIKRVTLRRSTPVRSDGPLERRRSSEDNTSSFHLEIVTVSLSATAKVFLKGHRLRLLVAGGAHPRFIRNHGDPHVPITEWTEEQAHISCQKIFLGGSKLTLPCTAGSVGLLDASLRKVDIIGGNVVDSF